MKRIEGNIVDIYNRKIFPGEINIDGGKIISIIENFNCYDQYIIPGFIDSHVHIESSMLTPLEFSRMVIKKGTVAIVNDPHEIANILGKEGIKFMLENARNSLIKMFFTIPSCVPATSYDFSGGHISSSDVYDLIETQQFIGLSEMMNIPGVLSEDVETIQKIKIVKDAGLVIDGHAPGLSGSDLKKYIDYGVTTDHECTSLEEALEKISAGMKILIREGSAAKNYEALKSLIKLYPDQVMFCTDDSHPGDIIHLGHIDKMVRRAVADGFDLFDVLKIACINPIQHYRLKVGSLRTGDSADFSIVDSLNHFNILSVYIDGDEKYDFRNGNSITAIHSEQASIPDFLNHFNRKTISNSALVKPIKKDILCIEVFDGEIITGKKVFSFVSSFENLESDINRDILKLVYLNRYNDNKPQIAYIHGIGLKHGAFASSISHDSHNIIAVGCTDTELLLAINTIISHKGGLVVVDGNNTTSLPLPIAGIMSDREGTEVADIWNKLVLKLHQMGCCLSSPFMTLSFMALIVIPELKIGEQGLFEYSSFNFVSE